MRDHIEFVQSQRLPWQDGAGFGLPGREIKLLSHDRIYEQALEVACQLIGDEP